MSNEKIPNNRFIAGGKTSTTHEAVDKFMERVRVRSNEVASSASTRSSTAGGSEYRVTVGRLAIPEIPSVKKR